MTSENDNDLFPEDIYGGLEMAWIERGDADVRDFIPSKDHLQYSEIFTELVRIDLELSWQVGKNHDLEFYLARFPDEFSDKQILHDVAYEEYRTKIDHNISASPSGYQKRYGIDSTQWPLLTKDTVRQFSSETAHDSTTVTWDSRRQLDTAGSFDMRRSKAGMLFTGSDSGQFFGDSLQKRLRTVSLSVGLLFLYLLLLVFLNPREKVGLFLGSQLTVMLNAVAFMFSLAIYVVLRYRDLPTAVLRRIELGLFGLALANVSYGFLSDLVFDHEMKEPLREGNHALFHYSSSWSLPFFALIISYGTLIPSSLRRCLMAVTCIGIIPLVIASIGVTIERAWSLSFVLSFLVQMAIWMAIAIGIATYGVRRVVSLREAIKKGGNVGSYQLGELLSRGAMGEVYSAVHTLLDRRCAIKVMHEGHQFDHHAFTRFEREVGALAKISHPNIVQIFDFGRADDGSFFYVMELLEGRNLQQKVTEDGPLKSSETVVIMLHVLSALEAMHTQGMIHRDVKPANIFLVDGNDESTTKLLDFGLVHVQGGPRSDLLTMAGAIVGTPAFMSPELAGGSDLDWRSDIYSLAASAYFTLSGQPPFKRESVVSTLNAHIYEPVTPLEEVQPDCDPELARIINRCLAKDPDCRFDNIKTLMAELNNVISADYKRD